MDKQLIWKNVRSLLRNARSQFENVRWIDKIPALPYKMHTDLKKMHVGLEKCSQKCTKVEYG